MNYKSSAGKKGALRAAAWLMLLSLPALTVNASNQESRTKGVPVLWQDPGDVASRDLYYGPGGQERKPQEPFVFLEEDLDGTTPKFDVVDRNGVEWKVKLGIEARPEVAAVRLVWAAGYFVQENYYFPRLEVQNMPEELERGQELIAPDGAIYGARLKRAPANAESAGPWRWKENPFSGTRELNGLRVMMAVISNLDLKDSNNRIFRLRDPEGEGEVLDIYLVSDLGGAFSEHIWPYEYKGNLNSYMDSGFIEKINPDTVDFTLPTGPAVVDIVHLPWYFYRRPLRWIGEDIPRSDARWLGEILGKLSRDQIQDAFRAAGYPDEEIRGYSDEVLKRIAELKEL